MAQPPNERIQLPTEEELKKLSHYAQVAYFTRCALRILPLVRDPWQSIYILEKLLFVCTLFSIGIKFSERELKKILFTAEKTQDKINRYLDHKEKVLISDEALLTVTELYEKKKHLILFIL